MVHEGVPTDIILERLRASETVYRLNAAQIVALHEQGVPDVVLDYMQETYIGAVAREQRLRDWDYWTAVDGFWYGGPYYGWPDPWYPGVFLDQYIVSNHHRALEREHEREHERGSEADENHARRGDARQGRH